MDWIPPTPEKRHDIHFYILESYVAKFDALCAVSGSSRARQFMHIMDKIEKDRTNGSA